MTELIKVFRGNSEGVLTGFNPGTPEDIMWQTLVTPCDNGTLQRSNGVQVTQYSTVAAQGSYRFHVNDPGGLAARANACRHQSMCTLDIKSEQQWRWSELCLLAAT